MKLFIHTLCLSFDLTYEESKRIHHLKWMPLTQTYKSRYYDYAVIEFCEQGLQIQIRERDPKEIQYDKSHRPLSADIIITPYKLLHPGVELGAIMSVEEWKLAMKKLNVLIGEIEVRTDIDIRNSYKVQRIDLTCDVKTPNDGYSQEIIAAYQTQELPYGYRRADASKEQEEEHGWNAKNAILFYNKNQGVLVKIYNKKDNLRGKDEYQQLGRQGLLRYEVTLTRKYLKKEKLVPHENLWNAIWSVQDKGAEIFQDYVIDCLHDLPMLSRKLLKDYLHLKYGGKKITYIKLMEFCKIADECKRKGKVFCAKQCGITEKVFNKCLEKFEEVGVSPVAIDNSCPYVPSPEMLLEGTYNRRFIYFAQRHTYGKELWIR